MLLQSLSSLAHDPRTWVALSFFIFIAIAGKPFAKFVNAGLNKYISSIKLELENSNEALQHSRIRLAEQHAEHKKIVESTEELIESAKANATLLKDQLISETEEYVKKKISISVNKIERFENKTLQDSAENNLVIALQVVKKYVRDNRGLVDIGIDERSLQKALDQIGRLN